MLILSRLIRCFVAATISASFAISSVAISQTNQNSDEFKTLASTASAARDSGDAPGALRNYLAALKVQPDWQEGLWNVGSLEYQRDHYSDAIAYFTRLTQLAPEAAPAWNFLGLCEFETRDYTRAREHLAKGQQLGGADGEEISRVAQFHLALLMIRDGNFDAALVTLRPLTAAGQPSAPVTKALGMALLHVPLLPAETDVSQDALLQETGEAAAQLAQGQSAAALNTFTSLVKKYSDAPYLHLAYASAFLRADDFNDAIAQCREELRLSPDSATAHELLGRSLEASGQHQKAQLEFAASKNLSAGDASEKQRIAQRYSNNRAPANGLSGDAAKLNDQELWNHAMQAYSAQNYPEAISTLKLWTERTQNVGTAWAVMGLSEFELKDYDNALVHLQRGQQLGLSGNFDSVQTARYRLAVLLLRRSEFENARDLLMSVAGHGPLAAEVRFALGMSLLRISGLPGDASKSNARLIAETGAVGELLKDSKYDQAFPKLQALIKEYPEAPFLHFVYGSALAAFSSYDEAAEQFRQEIKLSPASELPHIQLASIALKQRRAEDAYASAQQAVKLNPRSAESHYLLGRALLESGKDAQAITELETANSITPQSAQIHFNLAKAYTRLNLPEKAARERETFATLNAAVERQRSVRDSQSYGAHGANASAFSEAGTNTETEPRSQLN